jgi:hypothetical protein
MPVAKKTSSDERRERVRYPKAYKHLRRDPCVCRNCFRLIKERTKLKSEKTSHDGVVTDILDDNYETCEDVDDQSRPTCCECGSVNQAKLRPLSKERFMEYTENLSVALDEFGYKHDREVLLETARKLKEKPEQDSRTDDNIWPAAIRKALKR